MLLSRGKQNRNKVIIAVAVVIVAAVALILLLSDKSPDTTPKPVNTQATDPGNNNVTESDQEPAANKEVVVGEISKEPDIDFNDLEEEGSLKTMMTDRKESLGIKKSLDMIVKSNESFTVGENTVSMQRILEKAFTKKGEVFQEELDESGAVKPVQIKEYGIYVVQPGDNIWNIHFEILKEYYTAKGITVEEKADEPGNSGMSSGVGKILKFSETMVIIYNLMENQVTDDINIIEPLSKVVVYNMDAVFSLLEEINYDNVDRLQFDGKNIWIPAKKS
ncbi:MAG: hypothetical protein MI892_27085 [Desulfobacterales bacterium]|nr:hypothetical protein [Desulfobacterales bacterium]